MSLFIIAVVFVGLIMSDKFKLTEVDEDIDESEAIQTFTWAIGSFFVIYGLNLFVRHIPLSVEKAVLSSISQGEAISIVLLTFAVTIAIAEEVLFRGFLVNLISKNSAMIAIAPLIVGSAFTIYHLQVYGSAIDILFIVFGAGTFLGYAAIKTRRILTVMIPHILNNSLPYLPVRLDFIPIVQSNVIEVLINAI